MGAGQSSENGTSASGPEVKTSYYELIGVHRSATDDEIKKAYRRKALALHPDRNFGNEEAATKTFAEIQAAYEVLSDPQERAWYDSHEAAILRGDDVADDAGVPSYENVRITTADDLARLVRKFNGGVEFTDAPSGFFGFVRETFEHLAQEEDIAGDWEGIEVSEYPTFGHKDDDYDDVVKRFYVTWQSFSTVKTFSWKDKYRLSEAPDRWMRRRMEQENKKLRQDGVREFNDAVRSLVAFIRKRDPRYVPSTQTEDERQKILRDAAAAQAARARAANAARLDEEAVPEWTKIREADELEESSEEEIEQQIFECVACNKEFKSERQWEAHERSKKHQKAVYALQKKMRKENAHLDLDSANVSTGTSTPNRDADDSPVHVEDEGQSLDDDDLDTENLDNAATAQQEEQSDVDSEPPTTTRDANLPQTHDENGIGHGSHVSEAREDNKDDDSDDDYAPTDAVQARLYGTTLTSRSPSPIPFDSAPTDKAPPVKTLGKAAQKRAKKAAAAAATASSDFDAHHCATCHAGFPSKTRLFQHIKDHGHAAPVSATMSKTQSKKSKSKRG